MRLYMNLTSPFVRIARVALAEKGLADEVDSVVLDPWTDPADFLAANPSGRVPVLRTDDGHELTESMLIVAYLDTCVGEPRLISPDPAVLARAGLAMGAIEAAVAIIIGRKSNPDFDTHMVGQRRYRTMADALARLDENIPGDFADGPDIASVTAAVALDYILFRFSTRRDWLAAAPRLAAWRERQAGRPSLETTVPRDPS